MGNEFNSSWISAFLNGTENHVLILISDGFDDLKTMSFIKNLREDSVPVKLLGFSKRQVRSVNGIQVHPDLSLNNIGEIGDGYLLISPASNQIETRILIDPRIHDLIETILHAKGYLFDRQELVNSINQDLKITSDQLIAWSW